MCESMRACRTINNFRDSLVRRMRLHKKRNDEIEEVKRHRTELDRQPFHVLNRGRERESNGPTCTRAGPTARSGYLTVAFKVSGA